MTKRKVSNIVVVHDGVSRTLSEWADSLGMNRITLYKRYERGKRGTELFSKVRGYEYGKEV